MTDSLLLSAGLSMLGAAIGFQYGHCIKLRRENFVKWTEVKERYKCLRRKTFRFGPYTDEERTSFASEFAEHEKWLTGISGLLSKQQRQDIWTIFRHVESVRILNQRAPSMAEPMSGIAGAMRFADLKDWEQRLRKYLAASARVFPSEGTPNGLVQLARRIWERYLADPVA